MVKTESAELAADTVSEDQAVAPDSGPAEFEDIPPFLDRRGEQTAQAEPTPKQLAEAHDRARQLGLTIRGRKNFVLDDGKERQSCGDFDGLMSMIEWRETIARGEPTHILSLCGSVGTVHMHDKDDTSFHVERQEDGSHKKTGGYKTDPETGETINFKILEDGTQQETRRFPKEDDDDETPEPSAQVLTLVRRIKALVEKADRAADKAEQFYKAAGIHIKEIKGQSEDWETIVREKCGLGRSRAYELMAIADGKTTLEKVRADTNERKKVHRAKSDSASVPERNEAEPINQRVTASPEISIEQRRAENARLADDGRVEEEQNNPAIEEPDVADTATVEDYAGLIVAVIKNATEKAQIAARNLQDDLTESERTEIVDAIDALMRKWKSVRSKVKGSHDDIVEQCLSLIMAMNKHQRTQFFAKYTELSAGKAPARP